jgi:hypothetical protein
LSSRSRLPLYGVEQAAAHAIGAAAAAAAAAAAENAEESLEVPVEFVDALTCEVMLDPVRLPR